MKAKKNSKQILPVSKERENEPKQTTAAEMLSDYQMRQHIGHTARQEKSNKLRRLLASRSAHLPGYSWCGDWVQWMRNNHPLLALCCKYKENPIGVGQRLIILLGSISFGLAATNLVYLFYRIFDEANGTVITIATGDDDSVAHQFEVTYETVALWTLGSLLHSLLDLSAWHLTACACCMPGACCSCCGWLRTIGPYVTISLSAVFVAIATSAIIMRANYEESMGEGSLNELTGVNTNIRSYSFVVPYFVELSLVYFIYYPIMATLFFSGAVRPCLPCIGGRPKEIERQEQEKRKMELAAKNKETFDDNPYV